MQIAFTYYLYFHTVKLSCFFAVVEDTIRDVHLRQYNVVSQITKQILCKITPFPFCSSSRAFIRLIVN